MILLENWISFRKDRMNKEDDFESALDGIDFDAVGEKVDELQSGGGEVVEASDDCEGGACKI